MIQHDIDKAGVAGVKMRRFTQQLARVTDRAERIANFVSDARGQSPQRGQLQLLRALCQLTAVFDEYECVATLFLIERGKARNQIRAGIGNSKYASGRGVVVLPHFETVAQRFEQRWI